MNAVQCDYCGKFAPNPRTRAHRHAPFGYELPADWFSCVAMEGGVCREGSPAEDGGEFCSRECISSHFAKLKATA